jgi:hypothetical protein
MRLRRLCLPLLPLCLAAACGGGHSTNASSRSPAGSMQVVLDTAAGSPALAQVQVAGALLVRSDGMPTANLLAAGTMLTIADPGGEPDGIRLDHVPPGTYRELHLVIAPGSGSALQADGSLVPLDVGAVDVVIPLDEDVVHDGTQVTWLALRHLGNVNLAPAPNGRAFWQPRLHGSAGGLALDGATVVVASVDPAGSSAAGTLACSEEGAVQVGFAPGAELLDEDGNHVANEHEFLHGMRGGDEMCVSGTVDATGGIVVDAARRCHGNTGPRLLGRIASIDLANTSFDIDLQAETRGRERVFLPGTTRVTIDAAHAPIHFSHTLRTLQLADLRVGDLAKVTYTSRSATKVTATEIEITSHNGHPCQPRIDGIVVSVDPTVPKIVVGPAGNDPLQVNGQVVQSIDVQVPAGTRIERRGAHGGATLIGLNGINAGTDRIWIRGTPTGPTTVEADWVSVRSAR